jgi:hypothetical protein
MRPHGRVFLRTTYYRPPHEEPGEDYPFSYNTGRTINRAAGIPVPVWGGK